MTVTQKFIALLAVSQIIPAVAQEAAVDEAAEIRHYTVEMIVFSYAENVSVGTEIFPADRLRVDETPANRDPVTGNGKDAPLEADTISRPASALPAPVLLSRSDYTMQDIMRHLRRLDAYDPIMHFGWTQATIPLGHTEMMHLSRFGTPPPGLDGSVTLYLGRYLHLVVDLAMDAPNAGAGAVVSDPSEYNFGDMRARYDEAMQGRTRFRINEDRIFKSGDIRYFDHPKFGVVAKVTRVEEDENGDAGQPNDR